MVYQDQQKQIQLIMQLGFNNQWILARLVKRFINHSINFKADFSNTRIQISSMNFNESVSRLIGIQHKPCVNNLSSIRIYQTSKTYNQINQFNRTQHTILNLKTLDFIMNLSTQHTDSQFSKTSKSDQYNLSYGLFRVSI